MLPFSLLPALDSSRGSGRMLGARTCCRCPQAARSGLTGYFPLRRASYPEEHPCLSLASAERLQNEDLGPQGGPRTPLGAAEIPPPGSRGIWLPASLPRAD